MMQHQQQYQMHQYNLQQHQMKRELAEGKAKAQIISTPSSPNSSKRLSPKHRAEKHERESPFSIGKPEHRENRNETGANCFKHVKTECQPTGRTVREELEASRSKIPKPGKALWKSRRYLDSRHFCRPIIMTAFHAACNKLNWTYYVISNKGTFQHSNWTPTTPVIINNNPHDFFTDRTDSRTNQNGRDEKIENMMWKGPANQQDLHT